MRYYFRGIISHSLIPVVALIYLLYLGECRAEPAQPTLDFIYVNANIGEAAGGHSAIRLGSLVFHYQFFPGERFLLVRDSWRHFKAVYTQLCNRSLYIASLPVSRQTFTQISNHLTELLREQQRDCALEKQLRAQLSLTQQLQSSGSNVMLPCAGLFASNSSGSAAMLGLAQKLQAALGRQSFSELLHASRRRVINLLMSAENSNEASWGISLEDALLVQEFVRLVQQGATLAPEVVVELPDSPVLSREESVLLAKYKKTLEDSLVRLINADRPGQGKALFVQAARYMVVSRSLSQGTLVTLNPFSTGTGEQPVPSTAELPAISQLFAENVQAARKHFFAQKEPQDLAWSFLETAAGRYHGVLQAKKNLQPVMDTGIVLPHRSGQVSVDWLPEISLDLSAKQVELNRHLYALGTKITATYKYQLIGKNCATELLKAINSSFADSTMGRNKLGGWLAADAAFAFIPSWMHTRVCSVFSVREIFLPSYRLQALGRQYILENDITVWLRESNIISSTLYTPQLGDSAFLFFTDDLIALRPILGAANLLWGGLHTITGLLLSPFDQGERFVQGVRGMFYSVPELFFYNIRKGTYTAGNTVTASP